MDYRQLGASGVTVSRLCLGTMTFGDRTDTVGAREIVAAARDIGVNFIDTADVYAKGASERIVGELIRSERSRWILASKVGNSPDPAGTLNSGGLSRRWMLHACDESLKRLGLDYIDVYYLHLDDMKTPVAETVYAIGELLRSGRIRYFGVSNYRGWRIAELVNTCDRLGVPRPIVCQPYYNLLNRMPEVEILPACVNYGLGVVTYSPVARGVLTGKYSRNEIPADSRAALKDTRIMETEFREESFAIARTLKARAEGSGRTAVGFALAWLWANRNVTSVIAGPRTIEQWREYAAAVGTAWSADDEAAVDALVRPGHASTPGYTDPRYPFFGRVTS